MPNAGATLRLIRLDTSFAGFLLVFLPVAARTDDLIAALLQAAPILFISMCTFIANDLNDRERDEINHPERPLPRGQIAPSVAASLYFVCLAAALFTTRYWVHTDIASWYYVLIALSISYNHIVEFLPALKAPYVAAVIMLPVLIVASAFRESTLYLLAAATFMFNLGKEFCMDVLDRHGDRPSVLHNVAPSKIAMLTLLLQLGSFVILLAVALPATRSLILPLLLLIAGCRGVSLCYLVIWPDIRLALRAMRVELLLSFYFLTVPL